ncbi:unnamed protein product, partial [Closterium sp. NIES-54]
MLLTLTAEDLTFAKVSTALLSAEKDSTAQAKAYAIRAPMPQASVAAASAPLQRNRFPPCTYVVKYGNRKGQVCGGTNHPLATCFKKKDDEWYAIHGIDKRPPNWMRARKANMAEVQDPASASASDIAPADVRINLLFLGTAMINEASSQYLSSSQAPQYIEFTLDSGATHTVLKETLSFKPYATPIPLLGADSSFTTLAKGSSTVPCPAYPSGTVTGMCVPSLRHNLVAQTEIQEAGLRTIFWENENYGDILDPLTNKVLTRFTLNSSGLYTLQVPIPQVSTTQAEATTPPCSCRSFSNPTILYHHQLGHPNFRTLADMASKKLLLGLLASLPPPPDSPAPTCLDCTKSKLRQQPHPASPSVAAAPLDLVHLDVWSPALVPARGGYRYFLVIVDDHSRYVCFHLLHTKAAVPEVLIAWVKQAQTTFDRKFKRLHSSGGGEFCNDKLKAFCSSEGIQQNFTLPDSPQQNGIAESRNHTLVQITRCLLGHSNAPHSLWGYALYHAALLYNLYPHPHLPDTTPTTLWLGKTPTARSLRVWGRDVVFDETRPFYSTSEQDSLSHPPSLVWADFDAPPDLPPAPAPSPPTPPAIAPSPPEVSDPPSPVSSAAAPPSPSPAALPSAPPPPSAPITYHQRSHPLAPPPPPIPPSSQAPAPPQPPELITYKRWPIPPPKPPKSIPQTPPAPPSSPVAHGTRSHGPAPPLALAIRCSTITSTPPARGDLSHIFPDITESPSLNFTENPTIPIPLTIQEALSGPHAAEWRAAMEAEIEAFTRNHSFDDETPPPGVNIVGGKWLFRVKQLPDEAPVFKACYVAKGFTQQPYRGFFLTFSPTSKPPTICTLMDVAAREDFEIKSMDASSAFLQGRLKETVFMDRPEGFPGEFPPNSVWKLNRPVYGLKQAPREWHNKVKEVILSLDFHPSSADLTLFIRRHSEPFYILVYVDDFILVAKDSAQMTSVQAALSKALQVKDLGDLKHYLGMEITRDRQARTISLSQEFYIDNVLKRFEMELCTPVATPLPLQHLLTVPAVPTPEACSEPYPELVRSLMYAMMCTRPDLAYRVSVLSRYVAPGRFTDLHWKAAKRVLRYLQGTKSHVLTLGGLSPPRLEGYTDSSWADDQTDRSSSQGYCFTLGSGIVSWRSTRSFAVSLSSCEAELYASTMAAQEARWLTFLLQELGFPQSAPTLWCDNQSTIHISQDPVHHTRTKHIELRHFFIRDLVQQEQLKVEYVASDCNLADLFTKPLGKVPHHRLLGAMGLFHGSSHARAAVHSHPPWPGNYSGRSGSGIIGGAAAPPAW